MQRVFHGKNVDGYWRDCIVCGSSFNKLKDIQPKSHQLKEVRYNLDRIWKYARTQTLTDNYATIVIPTSIMLQLLNFVSNNYCIDNLSCWTLTKVSVWLQINSLIVYVLFWTD